MIYPPPNHQVWFTLKSSVWFTPQIVCTIYPPKLPGPIYPQIVCTIYPSNHLYDLTPPQIVQFWAKFQTHTTSCFASQRSFLRKTNNAKILVSKRLDIYEVKNLNLDKMPRSLNFQQKKWQASKFLKKNSANRTNQSLTHIFSSIMNITISSSSSTRM